MTSLREPLFHLARLLLGIVFLFAGAMKTADVTAFAGNVAAYQLLPYAWNLTVAALLPWVEIIAGVLLLFNVQVRAATLVLGGLNLVFIAILVSAVWRGLEIDCGCFGAASGALGSSPRSALLRDLLLLLPLAITWWWQPTASRRY